MRVPESWLRSMVNPDISTQELADVLTMAGLEVEEAEAIAPAFSGVRVARVLAVEAHPDADRLRVCRVDAGDGQTLQIVCGAPNVHAGMLAPCAVEGALLPGGMRIKRARMRGVESQGMLCSARELGISNDAEGLLALPESLAGRVGDDLRAALDLDACVLTLKLTPNRADCLSVLGVAREVAAITGATLHAPDIPVVTPTIQDRLPVSIAAPDLCGRFSGRIIRGVDAAAPTPAWMKQRLEQAGQRSISALVDISNYVMLELGRPSHIFDLDRMHQGGLTVRWARPSERLELLNGQTIALDSDIGVIDSGGQPESLAGIMGGEASSVNLETRNVFIEAAFWWPDAIRGRARRLALTTEAGHRFERGVDAETTTAHIDYITHLVLTICGGSAGPLDDSVVGVPPRPLVSMRLSRASRVLGVALTQAECESIFSRLGFAVTTVHTPGDEDVVFQVKPPSFRFDIDIEEDLIEEIARIRGFERIPARPPRAPVQMLPAPESTRSAMRLRDGMVDSDYTEVITYSFVAESAARDIDPEEPLHLLNPMASHQSVMRTSLLPGLLDCLVTNVARRASRVRIFEIGRTFHDRPDVQEGAWTVKGIAQPMRLAGLAWGPVVDDQWGQSSRAVDFFDVKADLEALAQPLEIQSCTPTMPNHALHPGRAAELRINGQVVGMLGELHPRIVARLELPSAPVVFEMLLDPLSAPGMPVVQDISRFPPVIRDMALVVGREVPAGDLLDRLRGLKHQVKQGAWIRNVKCFDEYRGKGLSDKEKSLAFRFILQSPETTLQDAEVEALMSQILQTMQSDFGARIRS